MNRSEAHRKYPINELFFDNIDSEEKAYFLGFLYADGYNNTSRGSVRLILQEDDKDIIEKFTKILQPTKPLYFEKGNKEKYNHKNKYGIVIANKHISNKLCQLGCGRAKTFSITFPQWLSSNLHNHFIRGYFDGDGSVWKNKNNLHFEIVGTENLLFGIQDILQKEIGFEKTKLYSRKNGTSKGIVWLRCGGNKKVSTFRNWLYDNANIFLNRKYNKFFE